jgi:large subunit ribosomal protein L23
MPTLNVPLYKHLKSAHVTEKAGDLAKKNQYIFKIKSEANKIEIKKAVEEIFKVNIIAIKIINIHKKRRRLGKIAGWKKGYKKAIITIKKGQKIEILSK